MRKSRQKKVKEEVCSSIKKNCHKQGEIFDLDIQKKKFDDKLNGLIKIGFAVSGKNDKHIQGIPYMYFHKKYFFESAEYENFLEDYPHAKKIA